MGDDHDVVWEEGGGVRRYALLFCVLCSHHYSAKIQSSKRLRNDERTRETFSTFFGHFLTGGTHRMTAK